MMMMCAMQEDSGMSPVKESHVTSHMTAVRRQSTSDRVVDRLERRHSRMAVTRRNLRRSLPNREYATLVSQPHTTRGRSQKSNSNSDIFFTDFSVFCTTGNRNGYSKCVTIVKKYTFMTTATAAALIANNEASAKLTTANGGTFT